MVARKAGLTVHEMPDFSRTDGGGALGKVPAVIEAAFSQDVLDGRLSPIVEVEKGRGVVLRATDHKLPQQKPLEAVRTEVVAAWKKQRGAELAAAAAADAVKRLTAGESWDAVAKSVGCGRAARRSSSREPIKRCRSKSARDAFDEPEAPGQTDLSSTSRLGDGDAAVMALSAVREDPSGDPQQQEMRHAPRNSPQQVASGEAQSYAAGARAPMPR